VNRQHHRLGARLLPGRGRRALQLAQAFRDVGDRRRQVLGHLGAALRLRLLELRDAVLQRPQGLAVLLQPAHLLGQVVDGGGLGGAPRGRGDLGLDVVEGVLQLVEARHQVVHLPAEAGPLGLQVLERAGALLLLQGLHAARQAGEALLEGVAADRQVGAHVGHPEGHRGVGGADEHRQHQRRPQQRHDAAALGLALRAARRRHLGAALGRLAGGLLRGRLGPRFRVRRGGLGRAFSGLRLGGRCAGLRLGFGRRLRRLSGLFRLLRAAFAHHPVPSPPAPPGGPIFRGPTLQHGARFTSAPAPRRDEICAAPRPPGQAPPRSAVTVSSSAPCSGRAATRTRRQASPPAAAATARLRQ